MENPLKRILQEVGKKNDQRLNDIVKNIKPAVAEQCELPLLDRVESILAALMMLIEDKRAPNSQEEAEEFAVIIGCAMLLSLSLEEFKRVPTLDDSLEDKIIRLIAEQDDDAHN